MLFKLHGVTVLQTFILSIGIASSSLAYSHQTILPPSSWSEELCKEGQAEKERCVRMADDIEKLSRQDPVGSVNIIISNLEAMRFKPYSQNIHFYLGVFSFLKGDYCKAMSYFKAATFRLNDNLDAVRIGIMVDGAEARGQRLIEMSVFMCGIKQFSTYEPTVLWQDEKATRQMLWAPIYTTRPSPDGKQSNWNIDAWRKQEQTRKQNDLRFGFPHRYRAGLVSTKLKDYGFGIGLTGALFFIMPMAFSLAISETPGDAFALGALQKNADPMASATGVDVIKGVMYGFATLAGIGITLGLTGLAIEGIVDTNKNYMKKKQIKINDEDYFIRIGTIVEK